MAAYQRLPNIDKNDIIVSTFMSAAKSSAPISARSMIAGGLLIAGLAGGVASEAPACFPEPSEIAPAARSVSAAAMNALMDATVSITVQAPRDKDGYQLTGICNGVAVTVPSPQYDKTFILTAAHCLDMPDSRESESSPDVRRTSQNNVFLYGSQATGGKEQQYAADGYYFTKGPDVGILAASRSQFDRLGVIPLRLQESPRPSDGSKTVSTAFQHGVQILAEGIVTGAEDSLSLNGGTSDNETNVFAVAIEQNRGQRGKVCEKGSSGSGIVNSAGDLAGVYVAGVPEGAIEKWVADRREMLHHGVDTRNDDICYYSPITDAVMSTLVNSVVYL
jgi:hypothetical protein